MKARMIDSVNELEYYLIDNYKMELSYEWN